MPPLKHAWVLLLNCTKILMMFATNWLYFKIFPDSLKATTKKLAGPRSAVGNVSGYRSVSDCRSRGREFDPGPVPYFRGD